MRRAFFARGRRDLFAVTSKEKMLHREPSSCNAVRDECVERSVACGCYPLGAIVESPDGLVDVDSFAERIGKGRAFGDG